MGAAAGGGAVKPGAAARPEDGEGHGRNEESSHEMPPRSAAQHPLQCAQYMQGAPGQCQVFWCDPRAFKETLLKDQLEAEMQVSVKCYRTADMCMRLLRKKQHVQSKTVPRFFLVSWSNAPSLVSFLSEENCLMAKVIILCDTCGGKGCSRASAWAQEYPSVQVATTWTEALDMLKLCASGCHGNVMPACDTLHMGDV